MERAGTPFPNDLWKKPLSDGRTVLQLTPQELRDELAAGASSGASSSGVSTQHDRAICISLLAHCAASIPPGKQLMHAKAHA